MAIKEKMVEDFISRFKKEYSRAPNDTEIIENLQDELSTQVIQSILRKKTEVVLNVDGIDGNRKGIERD